MVDFLSWQPSTLEAQLQQQLLRQIQNMIAAGQGPDTTAKAIQLAASGQGPEQLMQFFNGPGLTATSQAAQPSFVITPGEGVQEALIRDLMQMDFSNMLYGADVSGYRPGPMLPKPKSSPWVKVSEADQQKLVEKKPGLTAEQLATLIGMQPKYQEPKFADIRGGSASQVKFDPLAVQQRQRLSLYDILRGMR